ncbi:PrsW family intramembrane metalloprotease [Hyalangium rubrum]|uniref:PrsW family intramembrane metalloprotease n=1 Tax=Hyalangium rubrum TaxID=3103134 RepID=A0ABU5GWW1_9BACT|nr:PrsW family intramembrane metalloprotease [Hyalangium sp. s54d21]MDY7225683.1 PrsW family intramembrane metalloprotease [Hyalangium sp. s54d21]
MEVFLLGGSAVVPSLLLFWYIRARDKNPEPHGMLLKTFLLGALICAPVIPLAIGLESMGQGLAVGMWGAALVQAFLGAAIPEELFKYLVLRGYVWRKHHFDEPLDGVVYGATASLGFATLENILYVNKYGLGTAVVRAISAVPGHAFTGVVMGAFVGRARFAPPEQRLPLLLTGLGSAILLHGAYDAFLFTHSSYAFLAFAVLFLEIHWGRQLYKALQVEQVALQPVAVAGSVPVAMTVDAPRRSRPLRTFGSWCKLGMGGLGLSACGLWWLAVAAALFLDTSGTPLSQGEKAGLVIVSLVPTGFFLWLFRSGLRGPFEVASSVITDG